MEKGDEMTISTYLATICKHAQAEAGRFEKATSAINNSNLIDRYSALVRAVNAYGVKFDQIMGSAEKLPSGLMEKALQMSTIMESMAGLLKQLSKNRTVKASFTAVAQHAKEIARLAKESIDMLSKFNFSPEEFEPGAFETDLPNKMPKSQPSAEPTQEFPWWPNWPDKPRSQKSIQPPPVPKTAQQQELLSNDLGYIARSVLIPALQEITKGSNEALKFQPQDTEALKNKLRTYFEKGQSGLKWYDNMHDLLVSQLGPAHAGVFIDFIAATSPRMPVERNIKLAIIAYKQYIAQNKDFSAFMRTHVPNIEKAFQGQELSGPKVRSFSKNLRGDGNAVTLDTWMAKAFGIAGNMFSNEQLYDVISDAVRELAEEAGVEPRQYQAAVWTGIKTEEGPASLTAEPVDVVIKRVWNQFKEEAPKAQAPKVQQETPLFANTRKWLREIRSQVEPNYAEIENRINNNPTEKDCYRQGSTHRGYGWSTRPNKCYASPENKIAYERGYAEAASIEDCFSSGKADKELGNPMKPSEFWTPEQTSAYTKGFSSSKRLVGRQTV